jgi:hypothetical protein
MKATPNHSLPGFPTPAFLVLAVVAAFAAAWLPVSARGQKQAAASPNPQDFVGTWTATFKGKPFMTIHFAMKGEKLTGTMSSGEMSLDPEGNIAAVTVRPGERPITIDKVEHNTVHVIAGDKNAELRCTFRLKDATHAELEIITPPGSVAPKPIQMVKQETKH